MRIGFNRRTPVGIDIGQRSICAVQMSGRAGSWRIEAATSVARAPTSAGEAVPAAEELTRLAEVLYRQGFNGNRVVMASPETKVFSAALELPPRSSGAPIDTLARQELARAAKKDAGAIEVANWDIPSPPRSNEGTNVLAVGLAHEDAEQLLDAMEGAGFAVEALDCRCLAMSRVCASVLGDAPLVSSILDLSDSSASLTVIHSGIVAYDRPMREAGLGRLREALRKELKVDADGADFLIEKIGRDGVDAGLPEHTVRAARGVIDEHLSMVLQELRSVMAYAMHRYPGAVGPALLTGAGAGLGGLVKRVREELDLDARIVKPSEVVSVPSEFESVCGDPSLCAAVGLAMHPIRIAARRAA